MPIKKTTKATTKPKKAPKVATKIDADDDPKTQSAAPKSKSVNVLDRSGAFVRAYSSALHGSDYLELAKGYATKIGGKVVE